METQVDTQVAGNTKSATKSRGWSITINNPTIEEIEFFSKYSDAECTHSKYQIEKGEKGTPHLQGCIYYKNARQFKTVKHAFPRANIQPARDYDRLVTYCSKEDTRISPGLESGVKPTKGRRTDLEEVANKIRSGSSPSSIASEHPDMFIKYHKGIFALSNELQQHRTTKSVNTWICGKAGVGKTKYVFDHHNRNDIYVKDGTMWWDGYKNQSVILIDDFDGRWPYRDLLRLLDTYPYQGQVKGGYVKINSGFIYITCELSPDEIPWNPDTRIRTDDENALEQVKRRLDAIIRI